MQPVGPMQLERNLRSLQLPPPVAVLLQFDSIASLAIPGLPKGTILIKSNTVTIPESISRGNSRLRGEPGFDQATCRTGPLCTPAFAMTD
jgi:hypothetical protein